jgi:hypothetical protein
MVTVTSVDGDYIESEFESAFQANPRPMAKINVTVPRA